MKTKTYSISLIAAILGLASSFSLFSGCGGDSDEVRVAFVTNQQADFWNIAKAGCVDAEKEFGIKVEVKMPSDGTAVIQKQIVEDLISSGIDAIAISPLDADNQTEWLNGIAAKLSGFTARTGLARHTTVVGQDGCGQRASEGPLDHAGSRARLYRWDTRNRN